MPSLTSQQNIKEPPPPPPNIMFNAPSLPVSALTLSPSFLTPPHVLQEGQAPFQLEATFVLTKDLKSPCEGQFRGRIDKEGSGSKAVGGP